MHSTVRTFHCREGCVLWYIPSICLSGASSACLLQMAPRCLPDVSQIPFRCLLDVSSSLLLMLVSANFSKITSSEFPSKILHFCYPEIRFEGSFAAISPFMLPWLPLVDPVAAPGCSWLRLTTHGWAAPGCSWLLMAGLLLAAPGYAWLPRWLR